MKQTLAILGSMTLIFTSMAFGAETKTTTVETYKTETKTMTSKKLNGKPTMNDHQTATLSVTGMHCGSCKEMVTKSVCGDAALSSQFESCEVTKLDTKNQIGTLVINYKKDAQIDMDKVEKAIEASGDYKLTKKEISSQSSR